MVTLTAQVAIDQISVDSVRESTKCIRVHLVDLMHPDCGLNTGRPLIWASQPEVTVKLASPYPHQQWNCARRTSSYHTRRRGGWTDPNRHCRHQIQRSARPAPDKELPPSPMETAFPPEPEAAVARRAVGGSLTSCLTLCLLSCRLHSGHARTLFLCSLLTSVSRAREEGCLPQVAPPTADPKM